MTTNNILEKYSRQQLVDMLSEPMESWPDDVVHWINNKIAMDLLDAWLDQSSEQEYLLRAIMVVDEYYK